MSVNKTIWSVGGGKGGIGKSIAAANIGCALARMGKEVMLVDADLGGANLHTYFGIRFPEKSLEDFMKGRCQSLEDAAIPTQVKGLRLISGGGEFLGIANPAFAQKQKLITHIKKLRADYIIVDLGAGSAYNTLDFFAISNEGIVVLVPEPAAIQNAYIFLKTFVYRRLDRLFSGNEVISGLIKEATDPRGSSSAKTFSDVCGRIAAVDRPSAQRALDEIKGYKPKLMLNMAVSKDDLRVVDAFMNASKTFLNLDIDFIGVLYSRASVKSAARKMRPFMLDDSATDAHADMESIVRGLLASSAAAAAGAAAVLSDEAEAEAPTYVMPAPYMAHSAAPQTRAVIAPASIPSPDATPDETAAVPAARENTEKTREAATAGPAEQDVFGFNDNINHMGTVFHIQTEVQGGADPVIETIIYQGGRIFFAKRSNMAELSGPNGTKASLRECATRQHRTAIAAIKMNKITLQGLNK